MKQHITIAFTGSMLIKSAILGQVKAARTSFIFNADLSAEDKSAIELLTINLCRHMNSRLEMAP